MTKFDDEESWDDNSWDDDLDGDGDHDDDDWDDDNTIPCPHCRRHIHENAEQCPYCERYLSEEDAPFSPKPWWVVLGAILGLYAVYRGIVGW